MSHITFKGQPVQIGGLFPRVGGTAPMFTLTGADLADVNLNKFNGKKKIINIVPSLDTKVCATSARKFNEAVAQLPNVVLLNVSMDLPFAQTRFCETERLAHIISLSAFRHPAFGVDFGVHIAAGPLTGLLARAVVVLDERNQVVYAQLVPEMTQEPDYDAALQAVRA